MEINLIPCPKCDDGGVPKLSQNGKFVYCIVCMHHMEEAENTQRAIEIWNSQGEVGCQNDDAKTYQGRLGMKLLSLKLRNFKGVKEFTLEANGNNVSVYGDNSTGKTTISDAWHWLFTDKDSTGTAKFEIKTLNADGDPIHNLEHEVEGVVEKDGVKTALRKLFKEKWTRKRGTATSEFSGHTTDYFVNDVPVSKAEYQAKVISLIGSEEMFKMLTNPDYFSNMPDSPKRPGWKKRRDIIMEVCKGDEITGEMVIATNEKLSKLPATLNGLTVDEHRKIVDAKKKKINDELEQIPNRIDENQRMMPDIAGFDKASLDARLAGLQKTKTSQQETLLQVESGGEIARKKVEVQSIDAELMQMRNKHQEEITAKVSEKRNVKFELSNSIQRIKSDISTKENLTIANQNSIITREEHLQKLRKQWVELDGKKFEMPEVETVCPACQQEIPADKIEATRREAEALFNQNKAEKLEQINTEGQAVKEEVEKLKLANVDLQGEVEQLQAKLADTEKQLADVEAEIAELENEKEVYRGINGYAEKLGKRDGLLAQIQALLDNNSSTVDELKADIAELDKQIGDVEAQLKMIDDHTKGQVRINELSQQEKKLAAEHERLEGEVYLMEQFTKAKVTLLEDKIQSKFKVTRFKMFNVLVNGGVEDCCETLVNTNGAWVPYSNANTAGRMNTGIDIINTLAEHYGLMAPLFVDNSESVVKLIDTPAQVIRLVVSGEDKKLRAEVM